MHIPQCPLVVSFTHGLIGLVLCSFLGNCREACSMGISYGIPVHKAVNKVGETLSLTAVFSAGNLNHCTDIAIQLPGPN